MGMKKKLAKGISYAAAPKVSAAVFHPGKTAVLKAADWTMDRVSRQRRRRARNRAVGTTVGAAAIALPLGLWLGRKFRSERTRHETFAASA